MRRGSSSLAALVAVAAIAGGDFGDTDARILGTLAALLLAGATAVSGLALVDRATLAPLGWAAVVVAGIGFLVVAATIWSDGDVGGWKWAARSLVTARRPAPRLDAAAHAAHGVAAAALRRHGCSGGAGRAADVRGDLAPSNADGLWQLTAILWILTGLGYLLAPGASAIRGDRWCSPRGPRARGARRSRARGGAVPERPRRPARTRRAAAAATARLAAPALRQGRSQLVTCEK